MNDAGAGRTASWIDLGDDGDQDIVLGNTLGGANKLFRNDGGGTFADISFPGLGSDGQLAAVGDFDNDGDPDLYFATSSEMLLFRNDGGALTEITSSPIDDASSAPRAAAWGDYDQDGDLDLYVGRFGGGNDLYRNDGDGAFADVTAGPLAGSASTRDVMWVDADLDGDADLYIGNNGANRMLRNDNGSFADVTSGPLGDAGNLTSMTWADYDRDGDPDLLLTGIGVSSPLLRNDGGFAFVQVDTFDPSNTFLWLDYDNDADLDLYQCTEPGTNVLFRNDAGTFTDVTDTPLGLGAIDDGATTADYDNDGDVDIYLARRSPGLNRLLRNDQNNANHWIQLELEGVVSNYSGIGARIHVAAGGVRQSQEIFGGGGAGQSSLVAHFGLGSATAVDTLEIEWPSGVYQQIIPGPPIDQKVTITEDVLFRSVRAGPTIVSGRSFGASWADFDGDGDQDQYVVRENDPNVLLRNDGGTFVDVSSAPLNDAGVGQSSTWGDYDNDGDLDVYLSQAVQSSNRLFRNDGAGGFADVTTPALVGGDSESVAWADYDNDGDLDLYLLNLSPNQLLRNDGGTFVDVTAFPLATPFSSQAMAWGDYDNDRDLDLYVSDADLTKHLFRNDGTLGFVDVAPSFGLADIFDSRGVDWGDYDNDGDLDLYISVLGASNRLYRNDGAGADFVDVTAGVLGDPGQNSNAAFVDTDNDGDLDIYVGTFVGPNKLLINNGGSFSAAETPQTFGDPAEAGNAFATAFGDYDGDGDQDFYVAIEDGPSLLMENLEDNGNHWLHIDLVGKATNRSAIGTRVRLVAGGVTQIREVSAGSGWFSQHSLTVEFGLGSNTMVDSLTVRWPNGIVQDVLPPPAVDQLITIEEPVGGGFFDLWSSNPGSGELMGVNLATPTVLALADLPTPTGIDQLAVGRDPSTLYVLHDASGGTADLFTLDPIEQSVINDVPVTFPGLGAPPTALNGIAVDPLSGVLYTLLRVSGGTVDQLGRIDPATGFGTALGDLDNGGGFFPALSSLAFSPQGDLYGATSAKTTEIYRIDVQDLTATLEGFLPVNVSGIGDITFLGDDLYVFGFGSRTAYRVDLAAPVGELPILETVDLKPNAVVGLTARYCPATASGLTALDAPGDGGGSVELDWSDYSPPGSVTQYEIYRALDPCSLFDEALVPMATVSSGTTTYVDATVTDFTAYYYAVRNQGSSKIPGIADVLIAGPVFGRPNLVINEFAPAGGVPKTGGRGKIGEFVEIRNLSPNPIDITGFRLSNGPGAPTPDEEVLSGTIAGNGLFVQTLAVIDLPNEGGVLSLLPPAGAGALDIVAYGSQGGAPTVPAGFTVSRVEGTDSFDPDEDSFEASGPTVNQNNQVETPNLGGSLVFNEVLYTENGGTDYVELYNRQGTVASLQELVISDGVSFFDTLSTSLVLGPGQMVELQQGAPGSFQNNITSNLIYLYKIAPSGLLQRIDQLGWGGGPAPGPAPGDALIRVPDGSAVYLGNQGANWLDSGGDDVLVYGDRTPGGANKDPRFAELTVGTGGFSTIGAALGAATPGSRVLIDPGEYSENLTLVEGVELVGADGDPSTVRIVGTGSGPIVMATGLNSAVITGVTLANGSATEGAALHISGGGPTFRHVRFEGHSSTSGGGAVLVENGAQPTFEGCFFVDNQSTGDGGAVLARNSDVTLRDCLFVQNEAGGRGAALFVPSGSVTVEHSVFDRNASFGPGAGTVHAAGGSVDVTFSILTFELAGTALMAEGAGSVASVGCSAVFGQSQPFNPGGSGLVTQDLVLQDPQFCQRLAFNYAYGANSPLELNPPTACSERIGITGPPCVGITATDSPSSLPKLTQLHEVSPNPFNPSTVVRFDLARSGAVDLVVYDIRGRHIADVTTGEELPAGTHERLWRGRDHRDAPLATGVYLVELRVDDERVGSVRKALLLK